MSSLIVTLVKLSHTIGARTIHSFASAVTQYIGLRQNAGRAGTIQDCHFRPIFDSAIY